MSKHYQGGILNSFDAENCKLQYHILKMNYFLELLTEQEFSYVVCMEFL